MGSRSDRPRRPRAPHQERILKEDQNTDKREQDRVRQGVAEGVVRQLPGRARTGLHRRKEVQQGHEAQHRHEADGKPPSQVRQ